MKLEKRIINDEEFWIDDDMNMWSCSRYSEEQALGSALEHCTGCINCEDCMCCRDCIDCHYCVDCSECKNCSFLNDCQKCTDLSSAIRYKNNIEINQEEEKNE